MQRETSNEVIFKLKIKDSQGKYRTNSSGDDQLQDFVMACTVTESISMAAINAEIVIQDSANLIASLKGSEIWEISFEVGGKEQADKVVYSLRAFNISSRAKSGNADGYIVQCVSPDFLKNEITNVFGASQKLFDKKNGAKDIVEKLLKDKKFGFEAKKSIFVEDSLNKHEFIATNWRLFDTIYWIAGKSIRKGGDSKNPQNGFLFWESRKGFHFKSIDTIIDDVNKQSSTDKTDVKGEKARLYKYFYSPKKSSTEADDRFKIDNIAFPEDRNYLLALRNGSYCGYSCAFDPSAFQNSTLSPETFNPVSYSMEEYWNSMVHIGGGNGVNPLTKYDSDMQQALQKIPRRIRYGILPNRIYDSVGTEDPNTQKSNVKDKATYNQLPWLQAYQHLRLESFKAIQVLVNVPGNLDLYPGYGVDIEIPQTKPSGSRMVRDEKYSGRYVIAGLRHKYDGRALTTEMLLYKDSIPKST